MNPWTGLRMELKQHQEMWLRELKYLNPNEWYMYNIEPEIKVNQECSDNKFREIQEVEPNKSQETVQEQNLNQG